MARVETIKVCRDGERGWHLINKTDFDPELHREFRVEPVIDDRGEGGPGEPTKEELHAKLKELSVEFDGRMGLAKLQELLDAKLAETKGDD